MSALRALSCCVAGHNLCNANSSIDRILYIDMLQDALVYPAKRGQSRSY